MYPSPNPIRLDLLSLQVLEADLDSFSTTSAEGGVLIEDTSNTSTTRYVELCINESITTC